jgi:uncharacterized OB-fold protein
MQGVSVPRPVFEGLFEWPVGKGGMRLVASRCPRCNDVSFPARTSCRNADCDGLKTEPFHIEGSGRLISYTIQHYAPPGPFGRVEPYKPIAIGLVEFDAGVGILGLIAPWSGGEIFVGARASLRDWTLYQSEDGQDVVGWAFELDGARDE